MKPHFIVSLFNYPTLNNKNSILLRMNKNSILK